MLSDPETLHCGPNHFSYLALPIYNSQTASESPDFCTFQFAIVDFLAEVVLHTKPSQRE